MVETVITCNPSNVLLCLLFSIKQYSKVTHYFDRFEDAGVKLSIRSLPETSRICLNEPNQISSVLSLFNCSLCDEHQLLTSEMQC